MSVIAEKPRAILFDWDNTLVDSWNCIQESYNMTFRHFDMLEWSLDETKRNVAKSMRDSFPQMFGERWQEAGRIFSDSYAAIHLSHLHPLPGVAEMLARLAESGCYLGVVSNKRGHFLRQEAEILGWDRYFSRLVGAQDAPRDKPHPEPVHMALSEACITVGPHVWFVGDSVIDVECAHNSGCLPILLRPEPAVEGEFPLSLSHVHFSSCAELLALAV